MGTQQHWQSKKHLRSGKLLCQNIVCRMSRRSGHLGSAWFQFGNRKDLGSQRSFQWNCNGTACRVGMGSLLRMQRIRCPST